MSAPSAGLVDEESEFLRSVLEGYRTWTLRDKKIQEHNRLLEGFNPKDVGGKLDTKVQQLKAMTLSPVDYEEEQGGRAKWMTVLLQAETSLKELVFSLREPGNVTAGDQDVGRAMAKFRENLDEVDDELMTLFNNKLTAGLELKICEEGLSKEWHEKKGASELWAKRHAAMQGMRSAMMAVLARYDQLTLGGADAKPSCSTEVEPAELKPPAGEEGSQSDADHSETEDQEEQIRALSEVLTVGNLEDRDRILKEKHPGSAEHPDNCRACHFQGGLCWKGLSCTFCHICSKPRRKSKHQRDVDKRRQERYKQVRSDLGTECLDELTKIDDMRRQIMTSSEDLKRRMKEAYNAGDLESIAELKAAALQLQPAMDNIQRAVSMASQNSAGGSSDPCEGTGSVSSSGTRLRSEGSARKVVDAQSAAGGECLPCDEGTQKTMGSWEASSSSMSDDRRRRGRAQDRSYWQQGGQWRSGFVDMGWHEEWNAGYSGLSHIAEGAFQDVGQQWGDHPWTGYWQDAGGGK